MATLQNPALTVAMEVDPTMKAGRMSIRPVESLSWVSVGERSGALTNVAALGAVFSFRNLGVNPIMVRRVGCGFITTTAFTAAQEVAFGLRVARAFTASDTSGTAIGITGSNGKHRSNLGILSSVDCRIAAAAALAAGTKTLDANSLAVIGGYSGAVGQGITPLANNLFNHDPEDYPLILAQNEGFNILNLVAMGSTGVGTFYANMEVAEVTSF